MGKPYRVCPACGCNLDPGEICDCKKQEQTAADQRAAARLYSREREKKAG